MKAKQGAVVSKFMTFMNRKNSVMIELYERAFYNKKPGWDNLANFVYHDLCPNDQLRKSVEDVQFHPVKMIVFIKFKTEEIRDQMVERLKTGVLWTEYGVSVRGHSLDADVRLIRVLGVSPETAAEDIRDTFNQVGVGEVVDLRKGMLDPRRMPGVTNGTWFVRVRILDADKHIPPYIIRREDGELWSLNFEGRRFVCWKCGSPDHIGDKCKDQERTFEKVFGDSDDTDVAPHSWAAVVKGNSGLDEDARAKRDAMAKQIRDSNAVKAREKQEAEQIRLTELEEADRKRDAEKEMRQRALEEAKQNGQQVTNEMEGLEDSFEDNFVTEASEGDRVDKEQFGGNRSLVEDLIPKLPQLLPRGSVGQKAVGNVAIDPGDGGSKVRMVGTDADDPGAGGSGVRIVGTDADDPGAGGSGVRRLVIDRIDPSLLGPINSDSLLLGGRGLKLDSTLETIFGVGATRLAIEFEGITNVESVHNISDSSNDDSSTEVSESTPARGGQSKKRLRGGEKGSFGDISSIGHDVGSSGDDSEEGVEGESKKLKVGGSDKELSDEEKVMDVIEEQESQQAGNIDQMQVAPEDVPGLNQETVPAASHQVPDGPC